MMDPGVVVSFKFAFARPALAGRLLHNIELRHPAHAGRLRMPSSHTQVHARTHTLRIALTSSAVHVSHSTTQYALQYGQKVVPRGKVGLDQRVPL